MSGEKQKKNPEEFKPDENYYDTLAEDVVYFEKNRIGKIFGVNEKGKDKKYIRLLTKSKRPYGWRYSHGFNIYDLLQINKLFAVLRSIANKIGWTVSYTSDIEKIKQQLRENEEAIVLLEKQNVATRNEHEMLLKRYHEQKKKLMKSRIDEFNQTIKEFEQKINRAEKQIIPESELQDVLYTHSWLLGTEYISAEPQKMRGAHSKFDFYLERFNKTKDIVEIKLISDSIINKDGSISAKVIQAVDQLIEYLESSVAAAHSSVISKEEGINELRPRGTVIIGKDQDEKAIEKLHKWSHQLSHIEIMTYYDVLERAKSVIKHIEKQEVIVNE